MDELFPTPTSFTAATDMLNVSLMLTRLKYSSVVLVVPDSSTWPVLRAVMVNVYHLMGTPASVYGEVHVTCRVQLLTVPAISFPTVERRPIMKIILSVST